MKGRKIRVCWKNLHLDKNKVTWSFSQLAMFSSPMARRTTKSIVTVAPSDDDDDLNDGICQKMDESHFDLPSELLHDFLIVCFTRNIRSCSNDLGQFVEQLKKITGTVESFIDADQCVDFLTDVIDKKVIMITYGYSDDHFLSLFADIRQLCSIYLFGTRRIPNGPTGKIKHFRGVYHDVEQICHSIKQDIYQQWINSTPLSVISSNSSVNPNQMESSFMYTHPSRISCKQDLVSCTKDLDQDTRYRNVNRSSKLKVQEDLTILHQDLGIAEIIK